jgi:hypothetical protein
VLALDVVELHPARDREDRTAKLARDVVLVVARAQARCRASLAERGTAVEAFPGMTTLRRPIAPRPHPPGNEHPGPKSWKKSPAG